MSQLPASLDHLLPHAGTMRLLDAVRYWDAESIVCSASSHRQADHPLRIDGQLPAVCALEYGAQAMALHGALVAGSQARPRVGLLVAAHELTWQIERLDTLDAELTVSATRLLGSAHQVAYAFSVSANGQPVAAGRANVILSLGAGVAA